jgi:MFS transporter, ACS family, D-galactonate transporter
MNLKQKHWYPWLVVALLWIVALLNYLDRQMLSTMKVAIMGDIRELETAENFGRLMAIFLWIYGLMSPMAGLIADRISRKWIIVGSLFVWSGVTLLMGYATTFNQLYILRAIMGISEALYIPAGLALIADYHRGNTRSLAVGIHTTGIYVGLALGGFGATVAHTWSWETTFHSFGLSGMLYSIILVLFLKENRPDIKIPVKSSTILDKLESIRLSLSMLLGTISFWVILFYFASPSFPGWAVKNWLPTLFSESLGIDMSKAGPLSTITIACSSFLGVIAGGILSDRWIIRNLRGRIYTGVIGLSFTVPALLLLGFGNSLFLIVGGALLYGLGQGMYDANNMPILCQFVSPRHRAAGYGLMNMTGVFAGAFITSWLGKSTDAGNLGKDLALLVVPIILAITLQLFTLKPKVADKLDD